jgi:hypothetical protein
VTLRRSARNASGSSTARSRTDAACRGALGSDLDLADVRIADIEPSAAGVFGRGVVIQTAVETGLVWA